MKPIDTMYKTMHKSYLIVSPTDEYKMESILKEIYELLADGKQVLVKVGESKYTITRRKK